MLTERILDELKELNERVALVEIERLKNKYDIKISGNMSELERELIDLEIRDNYGLENYEKVLLLSLEILKSRPKDWISLLYSARSYRGKEDERAIEQYRKLLDLDVVYWWECIEAAECSESFGVYDDAFDWYTIGIRELDQEIADINYYNTDQSEDVIENILNLYENLMAYVDITKLYIIELRKKENEDYIMVVKNRVENIFRTVIQKHLYEIAKASKDWEYCSENFEYYQQKVGKDYYQLLKEL